MELTEDGIGAGTSSAGSIDAEPAGDLYKIMYSWIVPVVIGIPGNVMVILVASREHNRKLSPCIYMAAMGIADTVLLLDVAWVIALVHLIDYGVITSPEYIMRFHIYTGYTSAMLSGLFLAEMSIDRMLAIRFPMKAASLCSTTRAKVTITLTTILVVAINVHLMFAFKYVRDPLLGLHSVIIYIPGYPSLQVLTSIFQLVAGSICPFIIILACNITIIITLRSAATNRQALETGNRKSSDRMQKETVYLTRMLIAVSFAYVILTLPYRLYLLVLKIPYVEAMYDMTNLYWRKRYILQGWNLAMVLDFNFAINFFLYCIGGGKRYRDDAKEVVKRIRSC